MASGDQHLASMNPASLADSSYEAVLAEESVRRLEEVPAV